MRNHFLFLFYSILNRARGLCYHTPFNLHMKVFNINLRVSYNVIKLQQKKSNNNLSILQLLVLCSLLVIVSNFRGTLSRSIITSKFVLHGTREKFLSQCISSWLNLIKSCFCICTIPIAKIHKIPNLTYFYYWDYVNYLKRIPLRSHSQWLLKKVLL